MGACSPCVREVTVTWQFALCNALLAFSTSAAAQNTLGMAELKSLINGNTVHFVDIATGRGGRAHHGTSGQIEVLRDDGGTYSGMWGVSANGTRCMIVSNEICSKVRKNVDGSYARVINGVPSAKWTKITPGKDF
jgi:hypothetical protein